MIHLCHVIFKGELSTLLSRLAKLVCSHTNINCEQLHYCVYIKKKVKPVWTESFSKVLYPFMATKFTEPEGGDNQSGKLTYKWEVVNTNLDEFLSFQQIHVEPNIKCDNPSTENITESHI